MSAKRKLNVIADFPPPPTPGEALYAPPGNRTDAKLLPGPGKLCGNCVMFMTSEINHWGPCMIHARGVKITPTTVCGYHVFGFPFDGDDNPLAIPAGGVPPKLSGLIQAPPGGTRCGNCYYFAPFGGDGAAGACLGVAAKIESEAGDWMPAEVNAEGCCARWSATGAGAP